VGFKATSSVSKMDYNFEPHVRERGDIPEPSSDQIAAFFDAQESAMREWRDALAELQPEGEEKTWTPEQRREAERAMADYVREHREERLQRRVEILSAVCSGKPSVTTLTELGSTASRVLDAFESYIWEELSPKGSTSGSTD
jgi:acyl-CoA reductase-like NAD-dependent aldehyde dehydrogenase